MAVTTKKAAAAPAAAPEDGPSDEIRIQRIKTQKIIVPIVGTTPLIIHAFSAKARQQMLDNMQGRKAPASAKDPEREYQDAFYRLDDGTPGFPAIGFKACIVGSARFYDRIKMTELRQFLFLDGVVGANPMPLIPIIGEAERREDTVRVGMGKADLRYRPMFMPWRAELPITYVMGKLDLESVISLVEAGGMGVGVGEWRPERKGEFGTFKVSEDEQVRVVQ